jgi:hypothetical protein
LGAPPSSGSTVGGAGRKPEVGALALAGERGGGQQLHGAERQGDCDGGAEAERDPAALGPGVGGQQARQGVAADADVDVEGELEMAEHGQPQHEARQRPTAPALFLHGPLDGPEAPGQHGGRASVVRELQPGEQIAVEHVAGGREQRRAPSEREASGEQPGAESRQDDVQVGVEAVGVEQRHDQEQHAAGEEQGQLSIGQHRVARQHARVPQRQFALFQHLVCQYAARVDLLDRVGAGGVVDDDALVGVAPGMQVQQCIDGQKDFAA